MMAAFILAFSLLTLLMFFVSYCRSLTASTLNTSLTAEVRDVTGIQAQASGRDFARVATQVALEVSAHFAAVALGRRIALNREMLAQQSGL